MEHAIHPQSAQLKGEVQVGVARVVSESAAYLRKVVAEAASLVWHHSSASLSSVLYRKLHLLHQRLPDHRDLLLPDRVQVQL